MSFWSRLGLHAALAGAVSFGAAVLMSAPQAKAACLGGNGVCATFNPGTASTPTEVGNFTNTATITGNATKAKVLFSLSNFTGSPFDLTGISIKGDGIANFLAFGDVSFNADGNYETGFVNLTSSVSSVNFANSSISFTIPGGLVNDGAVLEASIQYSPSSGSIAASGFSNPAFVTTAEVPGPLPLLGAGVAFGISRKLRRRISTTA